MSQPEEQEEHVDENYDPEKEVLGDWKPTIELPEIKTVTGEEQEDNIAKFRVKLYRWREGEWKERGVGDFKFLQHKESKKIRVIMRQDKTGKVVANHFSTNSFLILVSAVEGLCKLQPQKTNDKAVIWDCYDISDEEANFEKLCAKFTSVEEYKRFEEEFNKAYETNKAAGTVKGNSHFLSQESEAKEEVSQEKKEEKKEE